MKHQKTVKACLSQLPRAQGDVFKGLVLFDQQSKTQRYSVFSDIKRSRKSFHVRSWNQTTFGIFSLFLLEKQLKRLTSHQNYCQLFSVERLLD